MIALPTCSSSRAFGSRRVSASPTSCCSSPCSRRPSPRPRPVRLAVTIARKGYDSSSAGPSPAVTNGNLNTRLFSLGLGQRDTAVPGGVARVPRHPWLGTGEGSYARYWNEYRTQAFQISNVHDLYLETLAELGPLGLALLLAALAAPFVAFFRARRRALAGGGARGLRRVSRPCRVDWDWQMPAVTLAALFCGSGAPLAAGGRPEPMRAATCGRSPPASSLSRGLRFRRAEVEPRDRGSSRTAAPAPTTRRPRATRASARFWAPWSSAALAAPRRGAGRRPDQDRRRAGEPRARAREGRCELAALARSGQGDHGVPRSSRP